MKYINQIPGLQEGYQYLASMGAVLCPEGKVLRRNPKNKGYCVRLKDGRPTYWTLARIRGAMFDGPMSEKALQIPGLKEGYRYVPDTKEVLSPEGRVLKTRRDKVYRVKLSNGRPTCWTLARIERETTP